MDFINVKYIYSACIKTSTPDITILHDPWFTEGVYDGSWFQFPKIERPLSDIGDCDWIYISHIHPDHYDSDFLKKYFSKYGIKKVLIADHNPNHLARKMRADNIVPTILENKILVGNTSIEIVPHKTGSISDIDSAIVVKYKSNDKKIHCIVNANDINFDTDDLMLKNLKNIAGDVDILLCGYTGAGPYPQTYFDISDPRLESESKNKKYLFFERYKEIIKVMSAKKNIPFAGKYILGGRLAPLNNFRGVADPVEVLSFDKNAIILADNGGEIGTATLKSNQIRTIKYNEKDICDRIEDVEKHKMDYERLFLQEETYQLPIKRLLLVAAGNANKKSECDEDYYYTIEVSKNEWVVINANRNSYEYVRVVNKLTDLPLSRCEIIIDHRYLFGLLTLIYHWNNAEVGSQYSIRRTSSGYNRKGKEFLFYLTV